MKKAIIFGARGQDGQLLTSYLSKKNYTVLSVGKAAVECTDGLIWQPLNLLNEKSTYDLITKFSPDEIYYLAAFHHSSQSQELQSPSDLWSNSLAIHVTGLTNVLEAVLKHNSLIKVFYASSCLIYGNTMVSPQTEETPFNPIEIYAITKTTGMQVCQFYKNNFNLFVACGILYNHESVLRSSNFVSQKIIQGALNIKNGRIDHLDLGNLDSEIDWGYAPNFVEAMHLILQLNKAENFIIATGKSHTVRDFVDCAFSTLGLDWPLYVKENNFSIQRTRGKLVGDYSKLRDNTGWVPSVSFKQMIHNMLNGVI